MKRRTPLEEAIHDSTVYLNKAYAYLTEKAAVKLDKYYDLKYTHLGERIPDSISNYDRPPIRLVKFRNNVIKRIEIMPTNFLTTFYTNFRQAGFDYSKPEVYNFIRDNAVRISNCRELYMRMLMVNRKKSDEEVLEITRQNLLDIAHVDRTKVLEKSKFRHEVSQKLIEYPQVMTWAEMYEFYLRNRKLSKADLDAAENDNDYTEPETNQLGLDNKYNFNIATTRMKYIESSPWKSTRKVTNYVERNRLPSTRIDDFRESAPKDSFNWKQQRKIMKHYVAPRYSFMIDHLFAGTYRYLLAININTRKAFFAIPDRIFKYDNKYSRPPDPKSWNIEPPSAIHEMEHILSLTPVKYIHMDKEGAFKSDEFRAFLKSQGIEYSYVHKYNVGNVIETNPPSRSTHTTSIIDRLCRTIRQMNHNLGNGKEIKPPTMNYLIDEYNNSVHTTLSKILERDVTPNEVDSNVALETELVKLIRIQNFAIENSNEYRVNDTVRVYNDSNHMDKVKPKLLPGKWNLVGRKNGLYKLRQNDTEIMVPRWMIKNE